MNVDVRAHVELIKEQLKGELRGKNPDAFSFITSVFSGGSSVDIYWKDGTNIKRIEQLVAKYDKRNLPEDDPNRVIVLLHRQYSPEVLAEIDLPVKAEEVLPDRHI